MVDEVNDTVVHQHLPRTLVQNWEQNPKQSSIWGVWLHGSLMHCDVTGFTSMSELLAESGKEGAELMAAILNDFFECMLSVANSWGGVQMKFGGDAMLLYFPADDHAHRAVECGLKMQSAMKAFSHVKVADEECQLRMRIGIHSGKFYSASVGQEEGLLHYFLIGEDVNITADIEAMAEPGQVVVSGNTAALIHNIGVLKSTEHASVQEVTSIKHCRYIQEEIIFSHNASNILSRYVMPPIAAGKTAGVIGEHRRVTVVFIYLTGFSNMLIEEGDEETLKQIDTYVKKVFELVNKYGGYFSASDTSEHGDKIIIMFGAPISLDQQEDSAIRFVNELREYSRTTEFSFKQQTGVNTGYVFAGEIGSKERREYTCIGDVVNLSARLMASAWVGNVLVSALTTERVIEEFVWHRMTPIKVKGKARPIEIFKLIGEDKKTDSVLDLENKTPFIGREKEFSDLLSLSKKSESNGCPVMCHVHGESGIGKSRLCFEVLDQLYKQGWQRFTGVCHSYNKNSAYSAWIEPLMLLFGISVNDDENASFNKIKNTIENLQPKYIDFAPLVADVLGIKSISNVIIESLDAKARRERFLTLIVSLIEVISSYHPLFMLFDNADWMDSSSTDLINKILNCENVSVLICIITHSEKIVAGLTESEVDITIPLCVLSADDSTKLISSLITNNEIDAGDLALRANGNPLFLEELSKGGVGSDNELPETINDVIMAKLDRLKYGKSTLQYSSVIGDSFDTKLLKELVHGVRGIND